MTPVERYYRPGKCGRLERRDDPVSSAVADKWESAGNWKGESEVSVFDQAQMGTVERQALGFDGGCETGRDITEIGAKTSHCRTKRGKKHELASEEY